ncbi:MAG: hypothetical protein KAW13_04600 [Dehalococcoidia bacterium]|nr:hypothetical protein [Dehalococcoidia bacterium]
MFKITQRTAALQAYCFAIVGGDKEQGAAVMSGIAGNYGNWGIWLMGS